MIMNKQTAYLHEEKQICVKICIPLSAGHLLYGFLFSR